jgi:hypothetical protein
MQIVSWLVSSRLLPVEAGGIPFGDRPGVTADLSAHDGTLPKRLRFAPQKGTHRNRLGFTAPSGDGLKNVSKAK